MRYLWFNLVAILVCQQSYGVTIEGYDLGNYCEDCGELLADLSGYLEREEYQLGSSLITRVKPQFLAFTGKHSPTYLGLVYFDALFKVSESDYVRAKAILDELRVLLDAPQRISHGAFSSQLQEIEEGLVRGLAQSLDEIYPVVFEALIQHQTMAEEELRVYDSQYDVDTTSLIPILQELARYSSALFSDPVQRINYLQRALEIVETSPQENADVQIELLLQLAASKLSLHLSNESAGEAILAEGPLVIEALALYNEILRLVDESSLGELKPKALESLTAMVTWYGPQLDDYDQAFHLSLATMKLELLEEIDPQNLELLRDALYRIHGLGRPFNNSNPDFPILKRLLTTYESGHILDETFWKVFNLVPSLLGVGRNNLALVEVLSHMSLLLEGYGSVERNFFPEQAQVLAGLGRIYQGAGNYNESEEYFSAAVALLTTENSALWTDNTRALDVLLRNYAGLLSNQRRNLESQVIRDLITDIQSQPGYQPFFGEFMGFESAPNELEEAGLQVLDLIDQVAEVIVSRADGGTAQKDLMEEALEIFEWFGATPSFYTDQVNAEENNLPDSGFSREEVLNAFPRDLVSVVYATIANYYLFDADEPEKFLEYQTIATSIDPSHEAGLLSYYSVNNRFVELYEILNVIDDFGDINTEQGCTRASEIAGYWESTRRFMADTYFADRTPTNEERYLQALNKEVAVYGHLFQDLKSSYYHCSSENAYPLMVYATLLVGGVGGDPGDAVLGASLGSLAFRNFTGRLLTLYNVDEFMLEAELYSDLVSDYLLVCKEIDNRTPEEMPELAIYRDQCDENRLLAIELASLSDSTRIITQNSFRASVPRDVGDSIVANILRLESEISGLDARAIGAMSNGASLNAYEEIVRERNQLRRDLRMTIEELVSGNAIAKSIFLPFVLSEEGVRQSIEEEEMVIFSHDDGFETEIYALTSSSFHKGPVIETELLEEAISELRLSVDITAAPDAANLPAFDSQVAYELYEILIGGFEDHLSDVKTITLVPSGPLQSLPFTLLITDEPGSPGFNSDQSWAYQKFTFKRVPAIRSLYSLRGQSLGRKPGETFLGIGDPSLGPYKSTTRSVTVLGYEQSNVDANVLRSLPSLPETRQELESLAELFDPYPASNLLLGEEATEAQLRELDLSDYATIAFATHGLISGEIPGLTESALVLTPGSTQSAGDGLLTASEIAEMELNADLVILSACNTNLDGNVNGDGIAGLSTAFLYAGVESLMVTHWEVESRVAAFITTRTLEKYRLAPEEGLAKALMYAIDEARETPGWEHPAFWAPFSVIGDNPQIGISN
jgi:CHAT domain-containing protein/tetratricopeptide (TPR) repeat protein